MPTNPTNTAAPHATVVIAALYKFVTLDDHNALRQPLADLCESCGVMGTLLLAPEGINGTIAGSRQGIDTVLAHIKQIPACADLEWKESFSDTMPFKRMKVRLKREIVTMGVSGIDPNRTVGTYVEPEAWNDLISEPDVIVVDTRNDYEVALGTFEGAIDPATKTFGAFPAWAAETMPANKAAKVAMFCTGGIRCEKATALLKEQGYDHVYHLKGGILKYLERVPSERSLWHGECFVFDERVSVGHGLKPGPYQLCSTCRTPFLSGEGGGGYATRICPACEANADATKKRAAADRQRQIELASQRGKSHIGAAARKKRQSKRRI